MAVIGHKMAGWTRSGLGFAALILALAPAAAFGATISGVVTDAGTSAPLAGVVVDVFDLDAGSGMWIPGEFALTDASGGYSVPGVTLGQHKVGFNAYGDLPTYRAAFWQAASDLDSADIVDVVGDLGSIDATLSTLTRSLDGTVTAEGSGDAIPGVVVTLYRLVDSEWEIAAYTFTAEDGSYGFWGVDAATFRVGFDDPFGIYVPEYYDDAQTIGAAQDVGLPAAGVSATLRPSAPSVSGRVERAVVGDPIEGAVVTAYRPDGVDGTLIAIEETTTVADGSWAMWGLGDDSWRFGVTDPSGIHSATFYDDKPTLASAHEVDMVPGSVIAGIDFAMVPQIPSLSGSVTDTGTGAPIAGCAVEVYKLVSGPGGDVWTSYLTTTTVGDGTWGVYGLYDGTWRVGFDRGSVSRPDYFEQYFSETRDLGQAQSVNTVTGFTLSGISVRLVNRLPSIAGAVTRAGTGASIPGVRVQATSLVQSASVFTTMTTADGAYALWVLPDGDYSVRVDDPGSVGGIYPYRTEYFDDAPTEAAAIPVAVDESHTAGADAVLVLDELMPPRTRIEGATTALRATTVTVLATEEAGESGVREMYYRLDDGATVTVSPPAVGGLEASATLVFGTYGTHTLVYSALDWSGNLSPSTTIVVDVQPPPTMRLAGSDRYSVAVATAMADNPSWSGIADVVLASGEDRAAADPLAAAGLCWAYEQSGRPAPLLLVGSASVAAPVERAIADIVARNGTVTLRVVGGPVSVPSARIAEIRSAVSARLGITPQQATSRVRFERLLATGSRYDMAAAIADRMAAKRGSLAAGNVLFANGADPAKFHDALALTPVSASTGAPVLLVSEDTVPAATLYALDRLGVPAQRRYAAGGPATLSARVLGRLGVAESRRLWGSDRYKTAVAIAEKATSAGWLGYSQVGVAARLPDALTGGVVMGGRGGVMLFTQSATLSPATGDLLAREKATVERCTIFGGPLSVSDAVESQIAVKLR